MIDDIQEENKEDDEMNVEGNLEAQVANVSAQSKVVRSFLTILIERYKN